MKKTVIALALCLLCGLNINAQIKTDSNNIVITGQPIDVEIFDNVVEDRIQIENFKRSGNLYNAIRFGFGYQGLYYWGKCSSAFNLPTGLCCSIDISYRRFFFGSHFGFGEGILGADNFHYDRREDYYWNKGEDYTISPIFLRTGFNIINKGPVCLTAFAGLGGAGIKQDTGKNHGENDLPVHSEIKGTSTELGLMARHKMYVFPYNSSLEITAGVSVSQNKYESIGTTYSLNVFLTFNLGLGFY